MNYLTRHFITAVFYNTFMIAPFKSLGKKSIYVGKTDPNLAPTKISQPYFPQIWWHCIPMLLKKNLLICYLAWTSRL